MERKTKEVEEKEEIFYSPERIIEVNDEDENIKLGYLRAILDKQDPSCKEIDDSTLRRFLRARDLDAEKASRMFIKYLTWRRSFVPKGSISKSEVTNQIGMNKMFMQGTDKRGCPVSIFFGGRHFPSKGGNEELKRFVVFVLDKLCSRIPTERKSSRLLQIYKAMVTPTTTLVDILQHFLFYRITTQKD
ncbi:hypothetical protein ABFX02_04G116300 [Erythranthe guttata]